MKSSKKKWTPVPKEEHNASNPELAAKLREWGENYGLDEDPYLEGLSAALEEGKDLAIWASNDVMALMPEPQIDSTEGPIYSLMVLIRNVLVFVPVALTWLAVGKATTGFSVYTARTTAASVVNFLQFWQNGYGVLGKVWTLSHVAEDDFYIIATVILLTFVTPFMNRAAVRKAEAFDHEAMRERLGLVIEVESFLFDKKSITPMTMNAALTNAIEGITSAAADLRSAALDRGMSSIEAPPTVSSEAVNTVGDTLETFQILSRRKRRRTRKEARKNRKSGNTTTTPVIIINGNGVEVDFNAELEKKFKSRENKELIKKKDEPEIEIHENQEELDAIREKISTLEQSLPRKAHARYEIKEMQRQLANAQKKSTKKTQESQEEISEKPLKLDWKDARRSFEERSIRAEHLSLEAPKKDKNKG